MTTKNQGETSQTDPFSFAEFKKSLSYGARSNLNFKFLARMNDDQAANFLEELMAALSESLNDGDARRVINKIVAGQKQAYAGPSKFPYTTGPFTPFSGELSAATVGLLTSSGHFVRGDDPQPFGVSDMTQQEAEDRIQEFLKAKPTLSVIPKDTPTSELVVRHGGYDIGGVLKDHNVAFPLETLKQLEGREVIGAVAARVYSFVGACAQGVLKKMVAEKWVEEVKRQGADAVLLVPI